MKIIRNNIIPFKGFKAINLFGVIFVRKNALITPLTLNHEAIHTAQMKELWYVGFYLLYLLMWLKNLVVYGFNKRAYRNIAFEREAYTYEVLSDYLKFRDKFYWLKIKGKYEK